MNSIAAAPTRAQLIPELYPVSGQPGYPQNPGIPEGVGPRNSFTQSGDIAQPPKDLLPRAWFQKGGEFAPLSPLGALNIVFGRSEGALLSQIHHWLQSRMHGRDGRYWAYNTGEQWAEQLGLSRSTVMRAVSALRKAGAIRVEQYEAVEWQQRNWYSIDYERVAEIAFEGLKRRKIALCQSEPIECVTLNQSSVSLCANDLQEPLSKKKQTRKKQQQQPPSQQKKTSSGPEHSASVVVDKNFVLEEAEQTEQQQQQQQTPAAGPALAPEPDLTGVVDSNLSTAAALGTGAGAGAEPRAAGEVEGGSAPALAPEPTQEQQQTPAAATPTKASTPISHSDKASTPITNENSGEDTSGPGEKFYSWASSMLGFPLNATHKAAAGVCCIEHGDQALTKAVQAVQEKIKAGKCDNPPAALTRALSGCWEPREKPSAAPTDTAQTDWARMARALGIIQASRGGDTGIEVLTQSGWEPIEIMMSAWSWASLLQHPAISVAQRVDAWYIALCQRYGVEPMAEGTVATVAYGPPPEGFRQAMQQQQQQLRQQFAAEQAEKAEKAAADTAAMLARVQARELAGVLV